MANEMRDRLVELLGDTLHEWECDVQPETVSQIADHLIENGVVVPPMKLGQMCFETLIWRNEADECRVSSITQKADGTFKIRLTNLRIKSVYEITPDEIGKKVFLTKSEAEQKLKEMRGE